MTTATVSVFCVLTSAIACSSTPPRAPVDNPHRSTAPAPDSAEAVIGTDIFDPCDDKNVDWLSERGYTQPEFIDPLLDKTGSSCSYENEEQSAALLSQAATPGDSTDDWVHHILGKQGPVSDITVNGRPAEMEIVTAGRENQDCHVVVTVDYGFLHATGGPRGALADSYPRDCDAARDFAELLLDRMDATWPSEPD